MLIGFIVNPIAGIGGRVGLKGSDGVVEEALKRGAKPISSNRAKEAITNLVSQFEKTIEKICFLTCSGEMGQNELLDSGIKEDKIEIIYEPSYPTSAEDTKKAVQQFIERKVDLVLFCGGDGTARDITSVIGDIVPLVGIPSGVKMHSGVFCTRPEVLATLLQDFINSKIGIGEAEILDLDEQEYRKGNWSVRLYGAVNTLHEPNLVQTGKLMVEEVADESIKDEMADYLLELSIKEKDVLFILGPGSTVKHISQKLKIDKTLLGIDAVVDNKLVGKDLDEKGLLNLLEKHPKARLVVSPIGSQGFILGRGNLQLSPKVIELIGISNIMVFATPSKLQVTPNLRVDTGNHDLDSNFESKEYLPVIIGYRMMRMHPLQV